MQLAIERNTSLLVDCPSHFLHATVPTNTHIHTPGGLTTMHLLELGEGRRQHRGTRLCHDPPERESLQWQIWISQVLAGEPQLVVPNPLEVLSLLLPLGPPDTQTNWWWMVMGLSKNSGFIGISTCRPLLHQKHGPNFMDCHIWTLLQRRLMVCYSPLPQSLPHCLRQASDSTSGWVVWGSSSWGKPWHENGSCQVTAACLRRASPPSYEKTRKGRSLSTQPRSSM